MASRSRLSNRVAQEKMGRRKCTLTQVRHFQGSDHKAREGHEELRVFDWNSGQAIVRRSRLR
jgi:hypothetical protein